jgi:hypothetical protein
MASADNFAARSGTAVSRSLMVTRPSTGGPAFGVEDHLRPAKSAPGKSAAMARMKSLRERLLEVP